MSCGTIVDGKESEREISLWKSSKCLLPTSTKENHDLWPSSLEYSSISLLHPLNYVLMTSSAKVIAGWLLSVTWQYLHTRPPSNTNQFLNLINSFMKFHPSTATSNVQLQKQQIARTLGKTLDLWKRPHSFFCHTGISSLSSSFKETKDSIQRANCDGSQTPKTKVWKWKAWNP